MNNSKPGSLNAKDWLKSFWMFLIASVTSIVGDAILQWINAGTYSLEAIHWKQIGGALAVVVITYLQKQFGSNSQGEFLTKEKPNVPPAE